MRALALEHLRADPVGVFGDVLADRGIEVDRVMLYDGEPLPNWRDYDLIVAMGAGVSVWQENEYPWILIEKRAVREAVLAGVPYFGVCFGAQLLADAFGARSFQGPEPEIGVNQVFLTAAARNDPVFRGFPADLEVCEWHSNHFSLPRGAVRLARSPRYENQAIRYGRVAYGIQCHLEPSLQDIRAWLADFPESAVTFEYQHGEGSVERLLEDYAQFVPFLQETARQVFGRWLENALAMGGLRAAARAVSRSGPRPTGQDDGLVGRDSELARIDAALAAARRGESAVLVLRGDAGIGKTALLATARERARGLRVLSATGEDSAQTEQPFAGLMSLIVPLGNQLDARRAAGSTDRFAAYVAAFNVLVRAAADAPLLLLVDDAHLLDDASAEAIAFVARRLGLDGLAMIVATESDDYLSEAESLVLTGLEPPDARTVLDARWGSQIAPDVADEIVDAAAGNPLALFEIPAGLTAEQRAGAAAIEDELPSSAEWAFLQRIAGLPSPNRQALLLAALAREEEAAAVARACHSMGFADDALAAAEQAGLINTDGTRILFCHPLARVAVTYSALRADRRAAHSALAAALDGAASTWHRARAATRADEAIAAELERLGFDAHEQGAFATAADWLERAARLTPEERRRSRRLLHAARAAHLAGHVNAALDHIGAALRADPSESLEREAEHLRGRIIARSGSAALARDRLVAVANLCESDQPALAAQMLADAVLPALRAGGPADAVDIARRAAVLARVNGGPPEVLCATQTALGTALIFAGDYIEGASVVDAAAGGAESIDRQQRAYLGAALVLAGRDSAARLLLRELIAEARAAGAISVLPYALLRLADVELAIGEWPAAVAALHEARRLAGETGQSADQGLALGALAWIAAVRGDEQRCRAYVDEALELAGRFGGGARLDRAATAIGLLELGRNQPESAIPHLREACRLQDEHGWSDAGRTPHRRPDLVEALTLTGRVGEAREELALFEQDGERAGRPSARAATARCRALLADSEEFEAQFEHALRLGAESAGPFDQARTHLLYGDRLIEAGKLEHGARRLEHALEAFERLGAERWAERARRGIREAGGAVATRGVYLTERLSARELEVALAVLDGGSVQDIAQRLLLGPRTVALQLASAAIKLGVDSPAALAEHVRRETGASRVS